MTAAAPMSSTDSSATVISGAAWRTAYDSRSMSVVDRVTRSPVPARSTVPSGRCAEFSRKSSRSSASTVSPSAAAL